MNNSILPKYFRKDSSIKTIIIEGKEWWDKTYGNSYNSVQVTVNYKTKSEFSFSIPFQYGYGSYYIQSAVEHLIKVGAVTDANAIHKLRMSGKITFDTSIQEGCKKRDVKNFGLELNQI